MAVFFPVAVNKGPGYSIYDWYLKNEGKSSADRYLRQNGGIVTAQDYTNFANGSSKLPTQLPSPGGTS